MPGSFETLDTHAHRLLKPLRVPVLLEGVFSEARDQASDLPGWTVVSVDEARHVITCRRKARLFSGESVITITCSAPEGVPATTVHVRSETAGGLLARDRANVIEFMTPFHRRVG